MRVEILGCSGGIGGTSRRTTSLLIDDDVLIDAGTGVTDLPLQALKAVDHVFISHAHLDHIACLPFIVDSVGEMRNTPLTMHATQETQDTIRKHIFNGLIWPDFSVIPSPENPYLCFNTLEVGRSVVIKNRSITALPANHTVAAVGFQIDNLHNGGTLVFSGDTTTCPPMWEAINSIADLRYLLIENTFPNSQRELAIHTKHFYSSLLLAELRRLRVNPEILITNAKPAMFAQIEKELLLGAGTHSIKMLMAESVLNL